MENIDQSTPAHEAVEVKDPRLKKLQAETKNLKEEIPNGYIVIELSTRGKYGAPSRFHVRNFDTTDLINLALSDDADLPIKVSKMLDDLILEKGVSVRDFHEKEVVETLIKLYRNFYSGIMRDVTYRPNEDDMDFIAKTSGGKDSDEYRGKKRALETGAWKPKFDIDLDKISYYETPDEVKTKAIIRKPDGFSCVFSFPRYGDVVVLREFIDNIFREDNKKFASLVEVLKYRKESEERIRNGENISYSSLPNIPEAERKRLKDYELEKSIFTLNAIKALHLVEFEGKDVTGLPLEQRIELAKSPRLDYTTFNQVSAAFEKMKLGAKEEITIYNPIQQKVMKRDFSFQVFDVLQAVRDGRPDGDVIEFV